MEQEKQENQEKRRWITPDVEIISVQRGTIPNALEDSAVSFKNGKTYTGNGHFS